MELLDHRYPIYGGFNRYFSINKLVLIAILVYMEGLIGILVYIWYGYGFNRYFSIDRLGFIT
jgi:hypothetical protein